MVMVVDPLGSKSTEATRPILEADFPCVDEGDSGDRDGFFACLTTTLMIVKTFLGSVTCETVRFIHGVERKCLGKVHWAFIL